MPVRAGSYRRDLHLILRLSVLAPFMIHEGLSTLTETAFGSHPRCVVSISYAKPKSFHGGNTGSNPVGDAKVYKPLQHVRICLVKLSVSRFKKVFFFTVVQPLREESALKLDTLV